MKKRPGERSGKRIPVRISGARKKALEEKLQMAQGMQQQKQAQEAERLYLEALEMAPNSVLANRMLANLYHELNIPEAALNYMNRALELKPADWISNRDMGLIKVAAGVHEDAISYFNRSLALNPREPTTHNFLANCLRETGALAEALEHYRRAIVLKPQFGPAYRNLAMTKKVEAGSSDFNSILAAEKMSGLSGIQRMHLCFALGKAYSDTDHHEKSMDYYIEANSLARSIYDYSGSQDRAIFKRIKDLFTADFMTAHRDCGNEDPTPIFIVGMPRSGTSLTEQILSSHQQVHGAGEMTHVYSILAEATQSTGLLLPSSISSMRTEKWRAMGDEYIRRIRALDSTSQRITDKMPQNFLFVAAIRLMLPNATIIHCKRNPVDTCLSIYTRLFPGAHQYSYNLEELGDYYNCYSQLMEHWQAVLPGSIYEIEYERLVSNPEQEVRMLLEFCNLPFDPDCLEFNKNQRVVRTASFDQVRQGMYKTSIGRWKKYGPKLQPLIDRLQ